MKKILVTGGCGYLGSHAIVALQLAGHEVVSIDNHVNSSPDVPGRIQSITGKIFRNYVVDLCDSHELEKVMVAESPFDGVIHFAAFKAVEESMSAPLKYYQNNLIGLLNLLAACKRHKLTNIVFSSTCTLYGNPDSLPVHEGCELRPESTYGKTKWMGEEIFRDAAATGEFKVIALRYFNPVGAHPSAMIGEFPKGVPANLIPYMTQTAIGIRELLKVNGNDYPTRDGTCVRDYIHVCDIADAHIVALEYLLNGQMQHNFDVFNLGTSIGQTVLEMVQSFEKVNEIKLNWVFGPRRKGDIIAMYANASKAEKVLGWKPKHDLDSMMRTAWAWEKQLQRER